MHPPFGSIAGFRGWVRLCGKIHLYVLYLTYMCALFRKCRSKGIKWAYIPRISKNWYLVPSLFGVYSFVDMRGKSKCGKRASDRHCNCKTWKILWFLKNHCVDCFFLLGHRWRFPTMVGNATCTRWTFPAEVWDRPKGLIPDVGDWILHFVDDVWCMFCVFF